MFPSLAASLPLLFTSLLHASRAAARNLWDMPVDFNNTIFWPSEPCVQSCLTGDQCPPCGGNSLSLWVGCTNNGCFCNNYATAYFYLKSCITANCCRGCVGTDPYDLIYGYCVSTGDQVSGATTATTMPTVVMTVTTKLIAPPSETNLSNASDTTAEKKESGLSRSDKLTVIFGVLSAVITVSAIFVSSRWKIC